jgi:hypothetical protein
MRCAFWYAWETTVGLSRQYEECVAAEKERTSHRQILSVAAGALGTVGPAVRGQ